MSGRARAVLGGDIGKRAARAGGCRACSARDVVLSNGPEIDLPSPPASSNFRSLSERTDAPSLDAIVDRASRKPALVNGAPRSDVKMNGEVGSCSRLNRRAERPPLSDRELRALRKRLRDRTQGRSGRRRPVLAGNSKAQLFTPNRGSVREFF